jgi:hypothetical protein
MGDIPLPSPDDLLIEMRCSGVPVEGGQVPETHLF